MNFPEPKNGIRELIPVNEPNSDIFYNSPTLYGNEKTVEIGYVSENGDVYKKTINVPYNVSGEIDYDVFNKMVEDHSRALRHKLSLGVIKPEEEVLDPSQR